MHKSPKELRNFKSCVDAEKCDGLKVIKYNNSDNNKNQNEENYTEIVRKTEEVCENNTDFFLQMQNKRNLNLGKITMFTIQLKMKIKNVHHYAGY